MSGTTGDDFLNGNAGDNTLAGGGGDDLALGQGGSDTITGGHDSDTVLGGSGDDVVRGGEGEDYVEGGDGDDAVRGGAGDDTLYGGNGEDSVNGGDGNDVIIYLSSAEGGDRVAWDAGDMIHVSAFGFAGGLIEGQSLVFGSTFFWANVDGAMPTGYGAAGTGVFVQDLDTRNLWWDADGAGGADAVLLGQFAGVSLAAENFLVIA